MGKDLLVFYTDYTYMSHNNCDEPQHCGENPNQYHFEIDRWTDEHYGCFWTLVIF